MICIIDCGTTFLGKFQKAIDADYQIVGLDALGKQDFSGFSGIIISGAPTLLTEVDLPEYMDMFRFIKEINVPVLGVCLGHQLLGLLHGAKISCGKMVDKKERIVFLKKDPLFKGVRKGALFREEHSEHISLPEGFTLLAKSESCTNEAMKHPGKQMYGVQFHPEASGSQGTIVLENFVGMCRNLRGTADARS